MKNDMKFIIICLLLIVSLCSCNKIISDEKASETQIETDTEQNTDMGIVISNGDSENYAYIADGVDVSDFLKYNIAGKKFFYEYSSAMSGDLLHINKDFVRIKLNGIYLSLDGIDIEFYISHTDENTVLYIDNNYLPCLQYDLKFETESSYYSFALNIDNIKEFNAHMLLNNDYIEYGIPENSSSLVDAWMPVDDSAYSRGITYRISDFDSYLFTEIILKSNSEPLIITATAGEFPCYACEPEKTYIIKSDENVTFELTEDKLLSNQNAYLTSCSNSPYVWIANLWRTKEDKTLEDSYYYFVYRYNEDCRFVIKEYVKQNFYDQLYTYSTDIYM